MDSQSRSLAPRPMSAIPPANKDEMRPHQQGDDDSVSITSTVDSDAQDVYEVEAIYTEFDFDDGIKYLVKWKGYSDVRCTWEPESSFDNPETILEWRKKKRAIKRGEIPNFDLEAWENQVEALEDARDRRKRRRRAKRLRLGLPVSSGEDEPEHSAEETQAAGDRSRDTVNPESGPESDSSSGDDAPLIRTRRPPRRPFGASASPAQQYRPLRSKAELVSTRVDSNNDSTAPQRPHPRSKPGRNERQVTDTASRRPTSVALNPARRRPAPVNPVSFGVSRGPAKKHDLASIVSRSRTSRTGTRLLPNSDAPKMWNLMSTRHKFDRASRIEPEPDPTQLELQRPAEWSPFQMSAALRRRNTANEDSLFVEQDDDVTMDDADTRASVSQPRRSSMRRSTSADSLKMATELPAPSLPSLGGRDTEFTGKRHSSMSHPVKKTSKVRAAKVGDRFREWNDGDVLCQVSYGFEKVEVGDVRLRHLSKDARRALLDLKKAHRIDVCFDDLCSLERFRLLTGETGNDILFNGLLVGYTDTQREVNKFGKLLRDQDLVAIFRIPSMRHGLTLLCYPSGSKSFGFLDRHSILSQDGALHIAAEGSVLPLEIPRALQTRPGASTQASTADHSVWRTAGLERNKKSERPDWQDRFAFPLQAKPSEIGGILGGQKDMSKSNVSIPRHERHVLPPRPSKTTVSSIAKPSASRQNPRLPTSTRVVETNIPKPAETASSRNAPIIQPSLTSSESPLININREHVTKHPEASGTTHDVEMVDAPADDSVRAPADVSTATDPNKIDLDFFFKDKWNITFKELAALSGQARSKLAGLFYLWFPDEADHQYQLLKYFLDQHRVIVLSNRLSVDDWEKFCKASDGVVLFYHTFIDFQKLGGFSKIARSASFSFWSVSLETSIQHVSPPVNIQRLFPHGGGFLITEDFMVHERDATIIILAWFREWVRRKLHNSWKLMLRPRVMEWLRGKYDEDSRFAVMDILIGDIVSEGDPKRWPSDVRDLDSVMNPQLESPIISQSNFPEYGARQESDYQEIPKGLTQEERNTDHLCEWFAAWAIINAPSFRRFCILTSHPLQPRWQSWQHVELVRGPENFYQRETIDPRKYEHWLSQGSPREGQPSTAVAGVLQSR